MLKTKAKTQLTCRAFCCVLGGFVAYMQLGVALFIHANIQPYIAYTFFVKEGTATSVDQVYMQSEDWFFATYLVFALCMIGMVMGLSVGKSLLLPETVFVSGQSGDQATTVTTFSQEPRNPRSVYLGGSLACAASMLASSFVVDTSFVAFAALFGYLSGFFAGTAYQAPMLAAQLYFPDRKGLVSKILLLGMASGIGLYSYLTAQWASQGSDSSICDVQMLVRYLGGCMLGHSVVAGALLSMPSK